MSRVLRQAASLIKKEMISWSRNKGSLLRELIAPFIVSIVTHFLLNQDFGLFILPVYLPSSLAAFGRAFIYEIIHDKAERYKEYLKINGLSSVSYYIALIIFGFVRCLVATLMIFAGIVTIPDSPLTYGDMALFFANFVVFSLSTIMITLCISTMFDSAKLASDMFGLFYFLLSALYFVVANQTSTIVYQISCMLPQLCLAFSIVSDIQPEDGMPSPTQALISQSINVAIYFALFVFLDSIVPDEYGIKKQICCRRKNDQKISILRRRLNDQNGDMEPLQVDYLDGPDQLTEDFSSAKYHEHFPNTQKLKRTIFINNLVKRFGHTTVIDQLTMMMYERQIFCLLGHNGAGKTTTINILTGILNAEGGHIFYGNLNFRKSFKTIRKNLGFCGQKDLLYDELTCIEHLNLIGVIRGIPSSELAKEINFTIERVGLEKEKNKLSKQLSSGNKRKLCLAMALLGDIKVLFLDEPTSGLDPTSRRIIWDLLRQLRDDGLTILLTTHHLDEADELADRIAILSKGKLHSIGTSHFLKKNFGDGYRLVITPKYEECDLEEFVKLKEHFTQIVEKHIQEFQVLDGFPKDVHALGIPMNATDKLISMFEALEENKKIEFSLEMNSLEDAFIRIGEEEDRQQHRTHKITADKIPESISKNPEYHFCDQFKAIFLRKGLTYIRAPQQIVMCILPLLFIILGCYVSNLQDSMLSKVFQFAQFVNMAFALNSSVYCGFPVREREIKLKYALKVMGCRTVPYWLGTYIFDMIIITMLMLMLTGLVYSFDIDTIQSNLQYFIPTVIAFGVSILSSAYMYGFMFSKAQNAYKAYGIFCLFGLYYIPFGLSFGLYKQYPDATWISGIFRVLGYFLGPFVLFQEEFFTYLEKEDLDQVPHLTDKSILYPFLLFGLAIIHFTITVILESRKYNLKPNQVKGDVIPVSEINQSISMSEINREVEAVSNPTCNFPIKVSNLKKTYENGFQAVRGTSFGVDKGEIFGLLGPNGAGKSTTFGILTALIARTEGSVKLYDTEIDMNLHKIFKEVGICPQFDCLWDHLTVREHLSIFGRLKGLHGRELTENIDFFIEAMQLTEHANKKSKILSGGNKRKLCVTNALIGSPSLQFFDEPSTGLDPVARKYLYETLNMNLQQRNASIILTTHSMTEAEALCHKIGILVNGKFVCVGSTAYLKYRYGMGYRITVPVNDILKKDVFESELKERFLQIKKIQDYSTEFVNYQIPNKEFTFSMALRQLEKMKEEKTIRDYALTNTNLEQIFIHFSRYQENREE